MGWGQGEDCTLHTKGIIMAHNRMGLFVGQANKFRTASNKLYCILLMEALLHQFKFGEYLNFQMVSCTTVHPIVSRDSMFEPLNHHQTLTDSSLHITPTKPNESLKGVEHFRSFKDGNKNHLSTKTIYPSPIHVPTTLQRAQETDRHCPARLQRLRWLQHRPSPNAAVSFTWQMLVSNTD